MNEPEAELDQLFRDITGLDSLNNFLDEPALRPVDPIEIEEYIDDTLDEYVRLDVESLIIDYREWHTAYVNALKRRCWERKKLAEAIQESVVVANLNPTSPAAKIGSLVDQLWATRSRFSKLQLLEQVVEAVLQQKTSHQAMDLSTQKAKSTTTIETPQSFDWGAPENLKKVDQLRQIDDELFQVWSLSAVVKQNTIDIASLLQFSPDEVEEKIKTGWQMVTMNVSG